MTLGGLLRIAWQALGRNVTRSFLTMLGIIIGVGAVITSMAIGAGAQAAVLAQIDSLGANLVVVIPGAVTSGGVSLGTGSRTTLTLSDVTAIAQTVPNVAGVAPFSQTSGQVVTGGEKMRSAGRRRRNDPGAGLTPCRRRSRPRSAPHRGDARANRWA